MNGVITTSQNIEGNIGSCAIEKTGGFIDMFHRQVYFINSCTGEIVSQNVFFDWFALIFLAILGGLVFLGLLAGLLAVIFSNK